MPARTVRTPIDSDYIPSRLEFPAPRRDNVLTIAALQAYPPPNFDGISEVVPNGGSQLPIILKNQLEKLKACRSLTDAPRVGRRSALALRVITIHSGT